MINAFRFFSDEDKHNCAHHNSQSHRLTLKPGTKPTTPQKEDSQEQCYFFKPYYNQLDYPTLSDNIF